MPLYEYECTNCHRHTEKIQKFSDPEITQCPYCGGELKRVISAPAFALKGGGWYADGYGNAKPAASAAEGGGAKDAGAKDSVAPAAAAGEGAKESKPAAPAAATAQSAPVAATPAASPSAEKK